MKVVVKDKDFVKDDVIGRVILNVDNFTKWGLKLTRHLVKPGILILHQSAVTVTNIRPKVYLSCSSGKTLSPLWNGDLLFVAADPFEEPMMVSGEDRVGPRNDEGFRNMCILWQNMQRR
ncbi:hypothetical protein Nepgr_013340 [Nepenthes gracilis]|uniref:Uncharacterized protein n=1 Tax=Nepenthes gracilis TaxID=150966 RepID=A0AAD3SIN6_NEPGR|nr:hypothetical protein Nepgr_013340 [Nepenthes gracilis]